MRERSVTLAEASGGIIVGIQTSADAIYHLVKLAPGRYYSRALQGDVELEDEVMKPLVSGEDAIPFATPPTDKYLLFPYLVTDEECRLFTPPEMKRFRRCWRYLKENEKALRAREHGKFDDDAWYRFGRNQNIDKQRLPKLLVPRLLKSLFAANDCAGLIAIDNVDVGGILPEAGWDPWYLLGILNSNPLDLVWRHTAKFFRGGYHSANKQFIAPLPIPKTRSPGHVAKVAKRLAGLYEQAETLRRGVRRRIAVDLPPKAIQPLPPELMPLPRKLRRMESLAVTELLSEAERFAKRKLTLAERAQWDGYLTEQTGSLAAVLREIEDARRELNDRVCHLFRLTKEDVDQITLETGP